MAAIEINGSPALTSRRTGIRNGSDAALPGLWIKHRAASACRTHSLECRLQSAWGPSPDGVRSGAARTHTVEGRRGD